MDKQSEALDLFRLGDFTLSSGAKSGYIIDCNALSDNSITALAEMICMLIGPFSTVEGIPRGGLRLAKALKSHCAPPSRTPHLIVDDVLTTGGSMERAKDAFAVRFPDSSVMGAVIFARGQRPHWIQAICDLPEPLWLKSLNRGS